ncbi:MAG: DUF1573 domain-containing protein [Muribaculaceae bacterium]|nr:DUF1573 domain-containing protein [Muribaculaceae bacterium]
MLLTDTLVVIGLASATLGTIPEDGGPMEQSYWLRNDGANAVTLVQGYTSCECTTMEFDLGEQVQPGDSTRVVLRFDPQGRSGEFVQSGTVIYGSERKRVRLELTGKCALSEATLLKRFPVKAEHHVRLSANRFDLGAMHPGERKERTVAVLHRDLDDYQELMTVTFVADEKMSKGIQQIAYPLVINDGDRQQTVTIMLDVKIL